MAQIDQYQFPNGLHLVAEPMAGVESVALTLLLPAGVAVEPASEQGVAALLAEMVFRGAGERNAREHSEALDLLGVERGTSVLTTHMRLSATMMATQLPRALPMLADMVHSPLLESAALEPSRDLALQAIESLEDDPQQKSLELLRRRHLPQPLGRSSFGLAEHIEALNIKQLRAFWQRQFVPRGAILGVAGKYDFQQLKDLVHACFGQWHGSAPAWQPQSDAARGYEHEEADSSQVHIALASDSVPEPHPQSMMQRAAVAVLSGGMSGRLFTEVREKRGLCYSVFASYSGHKHYGLLTAYAGTTSPRAQETLDVLAGELRRLAQGVEQAEFDRAIVGMKARLVMQGESTSSRAYAIAADTYILGQPRTLADLQQQVDVLTLGELNAFVRACSPREFTTVTIGPQQLQVL